MGLMMYASSVATPYVMDPLLDTMGMGVPTLCILGGHKTWEGQHWLGTFSCNFGHLVLPFV